MKKPLLLVSTLAVLAGTSLLSTSVYGQSHTGPITPQAGTPVQQAPPQPKITTRVALVNTPVVVHDGKGQLVNTLDAKDFEVTDNGVTQQITHFDLGGDPLSLVFVVETSSRIAPLLPQINKAGSVLTDQVMGAEGEAAVVGFNDSVDKLQDFTSNRDPITKNFPKIDTRLRGAENYGRSAEGRGMLVEAAQRAP